MSFAQFVERRLFQPAESNHSVGMIYYKIHHNDHTAHSTHLYMSKEDACTTKGNHCISHNKYKQIGFKVQNEFAQRLYFVPNLPKNLNNTWDITTGRLVKIKYNNIEYKKFGFSKGSGNTISYFYPKNS